MEGVRRATTPAKMLSHPDFLLDLREEGLRPRRGNLAEPPGFSCRRELFEELSGMLACGEGLGGAGLWRAISGISNTLTVLRFLLPFGIAKNGISCKQYVTVYGNLHKAC